MTTIIYKRMGRLYECADVCRDGGDSARIILDEPINGKVRVGNRLYELTHGCAEINLASLTDGEYTPVLITASHTRNMEAFIVSRGEIQRKFPSEEYVRELGRLCASLEERICELEEEIARIYKLTDSTLTF